MSAHFQATDAVARDSNGQIDPKTLALHQKLLVSNSAPEAAELPFIRAVVSETSGRLAYFEGEIARLLHQLKELKKEHARLSRYHAQNLGILSPLRRMPTEVLGEIFSWTLPSTREALQLGRFDIGGSPWVLSHVSSRWRTIVLSTPSLWSLVCADYTNSAQYSPTMLEAQISRARNLKVHFYGHESEPRSQIALFKTLVKHSSAWEELVIGLTSNLCPLLRTARDQLPFLRRLWIQWSSRSAVESIDAFRTAPSLFHVGIYNEYRHVPFLFPAHQLTWYDLDGSWATHESILRMTTNLVNARITIKFDDESWPKHCRGDIIALPCLQRLYTSTPEILSYLSTPALNGVALVVNADVASRCTELLGSLIARCGCNLQRLCLIGFPDFPDPDETVQLLNSLPGVVHLAIIIGHSDASANINTLMSQLTIPGPGWCAAQLSSIEFGCEDRSRIDYGLYSELLKSRWRADNCALKSATLVTESDPGPSGVILDGLHSLRQDGLDLLLINGAGLEATDVIDGWIYSSRIAF